MHPLKVFGNGLATGLVLQLAIGPVFFFIINLSLQESLVSGLAGVLAVTVVDYFYITLSIVGISKLLEHPRVKKFFGVISSTVLIIFGALIFQKSLGTDVLMTDGVRSSLGVLSSFGSVFLLTITNPMTIIFFTSLFTAKALEYNLTQRPLMIFGLGTGFATLLFMSASVVVFSLVRNIIPVAIVQILNGGVGALLVGYGIWRLVKKNQPLSSKVGCPSGSARLQ